MISRFFDLIRDVLITLVQNVFKVWNSNDLIVAFEKKKSNDLIVAISQLTNV